VRVEVGQGAEGFIPDAVAGDIQREAIPYFQRRDYEGALLVMANRVAERFAAEFGFPRDSGLAPAPEPPRGRVPSGGSGIPPGVALLFFVLIFLMLTGAAQRGRGRRGGGNGCLTLLLASQMGGHHRRHRSGWSGGWGGGFGGGSFGGGGGFGGFGGGGGFSGGGSSGSW
jgi:uncharacterized protein